MNEQELINEGYIQGKKSFEYMSKQILLNFDFEKVHKVMMATEWVWFLGRDELGNSNMGIPNIDTLKNHTYALLKRAYETGYTINTGGFCAWLEKDGDSEWAA